MVKYTPEGLDGLRSRAIDQLEGLRRVGGYFAPAEHYDGCAFGWDSGIDAMGVAQYDVASAIGVVTYSFPHAWKNGMDPSIVYDSHDKLLPPREIFQWNTRLLARGQLSSAAHTSGITQPQTKIEAAYRIGRQLTPEERRRFWGQCVIKFAADYNYRYTHQNPDGTGLQACRSSLESGRDNAADHMVYSRSLGWEEKHPHLTRLSRFAQRFRSDLQNNTLDPRQRTSYEDGVHIGLGLLSLQACRFQPTLQNHEYWLQDPGVNAIAIRGICRLLEMSTEAKIPLAPELLANFMKSVKNYELLWDETTGHYLPRDPRTGAHIPVPSVASLMALYNPCIPKAHREQLTAHVLNPDEFWLPHGIPSLPLNSPYFIDTNYWNGSDWAPTSKLVADGLADDTPDIATHIRRTNVMAFARTGPREYRSPVNGAGGGSAVQSWTCARAIDDIAQLQKLPVAA